MPDEYKEIAQREEEFRREQRTPVFREFLQNPEPYDILIAHGSNSASLIGFARDRALVPSGELLADKNGRVPFSGEISKGLFRERGVSKKAISFGGPSGQHKALDYATTTNETKSNVEGWTPEEGRRIIELNRSRLLGDPYYANDERLRSILQQSIEIEERRLAAFDKLSPQEQNFISNPFPVVYGIHYNHYKDIFPRVEKM